KANAEIQKLKKIIEKQKYLQRRGALELVRSQVSLRNEEKETKESFKNKKKETKPVTFTEPTDKTRVSIFAYQNWAKLISDL
ncbi:10595_t:CDS:2, partial [Scutellospora calospora]